MLQIRTCFHYYKHWNLCTVLTLVKHLTSLVQARIEVLHFNLSQHLRTIIIYMYMQFSIFILSLAFYRDSYIANLRIFVLFQVNSVYNTRDQEGCELVEYLGISFLPGESNYCANI